MEKFTTILLIFLILIRNVHSTDGNEFWQDRVAQCIRKNVRLSMTVRRKHDIQRKQFIDKGKVIYRSQPTLSSNENQARLDIAQWATGGVYLRRGAG